MSSTGHSVLRGIQNNSLSNVDLLVRECLQNSLDAARPDAGQTQVDMEIGTFKSSALSAELEGITDELNRRYPEEASFLAVRDSKTVGLTGPLREGEITSEYYGNLRKLIYEIGQPQMEEGKGGSWGYGKTVYFRFGMGLVLYYSRILDDAGNYVSRFAATLIEDEKKSDTILRAAGQRSGQVDCGIAWWGEPDEKADNTMPITDEKEIRRLLGIFSIEPYAGEETGTTFIVPFIDHKQLVEDACRAEHMQGLNIETHLSFAVQRWYAPRCGKYQYGSQLRFRMNGARLRPSEWQPFFQYVQELYQQAIARQGETINLRGQLGSNSVAGWLVTRELTAEDLGIENGGLSPYDLIGRDKGERDGNPVIVCYCRRAGMIINYELGGASDWTAGVPDMPAGHYLVAFFALNSDNCMQDDPDITLDEYMRRAEMADHMSWMDAPVRNHHYKVAERIKGQVARKLSQQVAPQQITQSTRNLAGLQQKLARCFMPPAGVGHAARRQPSHGSGSSSAGTSHARKAYIAQEERSFERTSLGDECVLRLVIAMPHERPAINLELAVQTGGKLLAPESWEDTAKGVGTYFPVRISQVSVEAADGNALPYHLQKSPHGVTAGVIIDTSAMQRQGRQPLRMCCVLHISSQDENISCQLQLREEK